jgi:hypothetical protein
MPFLPGRGLLARPAGLASSAHAASSSWPHGCRDAASIHWGRANGWPYDINTIAWQRDFRPDTVLADFNFGSAASIDGDSFVAAASGAPARDAGSYGGKLYVFTKVDGVWTLQQEFWPDDSTAGDNAGGSVAIVGDYMVAGVPGADANGVNSGAACVFVRSGGVWIQQERIVPSFAPFTQPGYSWGSVVDMYDDTLMLSAPYHTLAGYGAISIWKRTGELWEAQELDTEPGNEYFCGSDTADADYFGSACALYANACCATAPRHASRKGGFYIFERTGDEWTEVLAYDGTIFLGYLGDSCAIDNGVAAVGQVKADGDTGYVYIFEKVGGSWELADTLRAAAMGPGSDFGRAVKFRNASRLYVGYGGGVIEYNKIGGVWTEGDVLEPTGYYGGVVDCDALGNIILGAPGGPPNGTGYVSVYG